MKATYSNIHKFTWGQLTEELKQPYHLPLTVHLPIQPLHSPDFIHVDAALNVSRRRIAQNLSLSDHAAFQKARESETFVVQFALDEGPFVPDARLSTMRLAEGKYPVAMADYFAWDLHYQFEYACRAIDGQQSLIWIFGKVTNERDCSQKAHVRVKVNFQRECDIFDYHYVPFYWDNSKWLKCTSVGLDGNRILKEGKVIGKVSEGSFPYSWEKESHFGDGDYNVSGDTNIWGKFNCEHPYFVTPSLRLKEIQDVIHFQDELKPGESRTFAIALLTNYEEIKAEHVAALNAAAWPADRNAAMAGFKAQVDGNRTSLLFPKNQWDSAFTELQLSTLQLLVRFPGSDGYTTTQGGTSERHFVWIWEATFMLLPMLRLGHFGPVRQGLEYMFTLQDGGCPPEGEFTTTEGSIGTTGPRWNNATGSALALAAEYYLLSRDEEFLESYLPKIVKAAGWITGEIRATRKLLPDGTRPPQFGLMPFGCATDGDVGYIVAFTDAYTFWGLNKTVRLLEEIQHERAAEFRKELEAYRDDIAQAIRTMIRADGFIERKIKDDNNIILKKFDNICCALHLAFTGNMDVNSEEFLRFATYFETHLMDGFFAGRMDREIVYMSVGEYMWNHIYLLRGEWKKAFAAMQVNFQYGMTPDTFQVQERFSRRNCAFTPWQPNGSGNGRMLDMMLNALYFEHDGMVTLLGNIPFSWLIQNGKTALRELHTATGKVTLEVDAVDARQCRLRMTGSLPGRIRFPDHFVVSSQNEAIVECGSGFFELREKTKEGVFLLTDANV
jgi:hypothetical protein